MRVSLRIRLLDFSLKCQTLIWGYSATDALPSSASLWELLLSLSLSSFAHSLQKGLSGLYSNGFGTSALGVFVFRAAYFGLYDSGKLLLLHNPQRSTFLQNFLIAQITTPIAILLSYPIDRVRSLMIQGAARNGDKIFMGHIQGAFQTT
jgi:hypothetical protein